MLDEFHARLNRPDVLDQRYLRRNHLAYPLVSYVNHIVALSQCKNFGAMCTFIDRAARELDDVGERLSPEYTAVVRDYLSAASQLLLDSTEVDPLTKHRLRDDADRRSR